MLTPVGCSSSPRPPRVTAPKLLSAVWSPEAGGLCVQLDRGLDELGSDGLMGGTQLRLSGPTLPRSVYAEPTPAGAMCFRIAESPAEMRRIKPGPVTVHALIDGDLYEVDTRLLDQTSLDRLFEWSLAESRSESGIAGPGGSVEIEYRVEPQPVPAGGRAVVKALARSTGTRPVYRLHTRLEPATETGLDPIDFQFGMLEPGETLELEQRVHIPRRVRQSAASFAVTSSEQHNAAIDTSESLTIAVNPLPLPALETTLEILPDRHGRVVDPVSGELRFRPGDDVHLVCNVKNFGDSPLVGGVARLRTPVADSASVRIGRAIVGDLPPSASGRVSIWLVVTAPLGSDPVPIVVEIEDQDLGVVAEATTILFIEPRPAKRTGD
ncbi:MAG: hypothetical protein KDA31_00290 [Phycisphaerales bacterium]|nr:hypothetical protein [Phycisphaerales bacterium]MCB9835985.1 hypothetical protein [Phycisphaera sp.]